MNRFTKFAAAAALCSPLVIGSAFATVATVGSVGPIELMIMSGGSSNTVLYSGSPTYLNYSAGYGQKAPLAAINGWSVNVTGTSSAPSINSLFGLDLASLAVTCSGQKWGRSADPLTLAISATGFTTSIGPDGLQGGFGGSAIGGVATSTAYYDLNNNYFCNSTTTAGMDCGGTNEIGTASLSGAVGGSFLGGPTLSTIRSYSVTIVDTFAANNLGDPTYSVDTTVTQAPEPGTLAMFGAGLLGCALFINRRRRASRQS